YLMTPPVEDATAFAVTLTVALAAGDVAAVLLRLAAGDEDTQINRVKTLARIVQDKDAAMLLDGHVDVVARSGADGAHLADYAQFSEALAKLKPDHIAGCGGLDTRHDAMAAAEAGTDYVMFGEPDATGERPSFEAIEERVAWWAEVFEAPCVAYAANLNEIEPLVKAGADFVALGDWVWRDAQHIAAQITDAAARMKLPETAS
ncbi:MAG: thiamine phosphate synthase, partial [Pseudolabrys sp.]